MAKKKTKRYNSTKEIKAIARERIGTVPPTRAIEPEKRRAKPKHKRDLAKGPAEPDAE